MKRMNQGIFWAIFLVLAGIFLLLKNLDVFGEWGQVAWGGIFALIGLIFLFSFVVDVQQWWRAIPGWVLLSIGLHVLLEWRHVQLGFWSNSLVLFGMALAFWSALPVRRENWWAEIPAGVLTVLGVLIGLQGSLRPDSTQWLVALLVGLGLVFALLYVLRLGDRETWWPAVPAAALILFGLVTLIGPIGPEQGLLRWWPVLLVPVGIAAMILSAQRLPMRTPGSAGKPLPGASQGAQPMGEFYGERPARGASVTQVVPDAEFPQAPARPARAPDAPVAAALPAVAPEPAAAEPTPRSDSGQEVSTDQLYDLLRTQPPEPPAEDPPA